MPREVETQVHEGRNLVLNTVFPRRKNEEKERNTGPIGSDKVDISNRTIAHIGQTMFQVGNKNIMTYPLSRSLGGPSQLYKLLHHRGLLGVG